MIHDPNIPGSYTILFFTASSFSFPTRHIHNLTLFLLWPSCFILTVSMSNYPPLFPVAYWTSSNLGGSSSGVISLFHFILSMGFSRQEYWSGLPFLSPVDHILSEFFTMTHPSWVTLQGMAYSFIELCKPLHHHKAVIHEGERKSIDDAKIYYHNETK